MAKYSFTPKVDSFCKILRNRFSQSTIVYPDNWSQSVIPGPAAAASLRNLLETDILGLHPRSTESKTLGAIWVLVSISDDSDAAKAQELQF